MSNRAIETLVWVLIYAGLLTVGLGLAVGGLSASLRLWLLAAGSTATAIGVVLIVVRSRRPPDDTHPPPPAPR